MSIFNLLSFGVKTAANIYQTRRETKQLEAQAERNHVERMVNGEVEYKKLLLQVTIMVGKMSSYWFLYPFLLFYWLTLFSLTTLKFVLN